MSGALKKTGWLLDEGGVELIVTCNCGQRHIVPLAKPGMLLFHEDNHEKVIEWLIKKYSPRSQQRTLDLYA